MRLKIWIAVLLTVALASTLAIPVCALEDQMYSAPQYSERQQLGAAYIAQNGRSGPAFWDFNAAQEIGSASGAALGGRSSDRAGGCACGRYGRDCSVGIPGCGRPGSRGPQAGRRIDGVSKTRRSICCAGRSVIYGVTSQKRYDPSAPGLLMGEMMSKPHTWERKLSTQSLPSRIPGATRSSTSAPLMRAVLLPGVRITVEP